jgi:hypothetical protein
VPQQPPSTSRCPNCRPAHGFLVGLGCLAASFAYQDQLFNAELRKLDADGRPDWRNRFRERLRAIAGRYPPRHEALADTACTLVEGGLILGRVLQDNTILPRQILLFRDFVCMIFVPPQA